MLMLIVQFMSSTRCVYQGLMLLPCQSFHEALTFHPGSKSPLLCHNGFQFLNFDLCNTRQNKMWRIAIISYQQHKCL